MNMKLNRIHPEELRMATDRKAHPDDEALELYALGRLDEPELGELEEHILICAGCQDRLDQATEFANLMREATAKVASAPEPEPAWKKWFRFDWMPMPAMAGAMAVLFAVMMWQPWQQKPPAQWQTVELETVRGEANGAAGAAGAALHLKMDVAGLDATGATAQIVTAGGETVSEVPVDEAGGKAEIRYEKGLSAGRYWVRLRKSGETIREFALLTR